MYHFLVDFRSTGVAEILDVHKYLMKKHDIEKFWVCLQIFYFIIKRLPLTLASE